MKLNQTGRLLALFAAMLFAAPGITAQDYCSSDGGSGYYDIYSIAFGDAVFNATGDDDGYGDYTDVLVDAEAGQDLTLALQAGGPWWQRYYWRVWVDFGNDGSFDGDLQDEVNGYFTQYATIHVPADFDGQARIRVNVSRHEYQGACAHYNTGEVEDYTLNVGESCAANAGTLYAAEGNVCFDGSATLTAVPNGDAVVPEGFSTVFVLTEGAGLVIENAGGEPSFTVAEEGNYTIHTLVYDPATLDLGIVELGVTTGFDVFGLITDGGGSICASLDVPGAAFHVSEDVCPEPCASIVGLQFSNGDESVVLENGGTYTLTDLPAGFYTEIITEGEVGSALIAVEGDGGADFSIENFFPYTYPGGNVPWELGEGTYTVSASLFSFSHLNGELCDEALFTFSLEACSAAAGTMTADADAVCFDGANMISAMANGDAVVPDGFSNIYVLTQGEGLVILNAGAEPAFEVTEAGNYTIHSLVYNPETLDLGIVEFGVTTGFDVFGLITEGGGSICASLDVAGAPVAVEAPMAGTLSGGGEACLVDGAAMLIASPNGDINVPAGYSSLFVLTQGEGLTLVNAGAEPSFEVAETGLFTIHTLVYNPATLDLGIVEFGVTTGVDVFGLISEGAGAICASLDVAGAPFNVVNPSAGTMTADADAVCFDGANMISAMANGDAVVPDGFSNIYVLTQGEGLVIVNAGAEPAFEVTEAGNYTIHSLVYNPETLDLGIVEFGVTTGFDVFGLITEGGGSICASLDVAGAPVAVEAPMAGTLSGGGEACLVDGVAMLTASPNGDINVPAGYSSLFVLTQGEGLTLVNAGAEPSFEVAETGLFTIHTLVYNPATLDLGIVEFGVTTGVDVFGLISEGGGAICASLDVAGAPFNVVNPSAGTMTADADAVCFDGANMISAMANGDAVVPEGFSNIYVLTQGEGLVIVNAGAEPAFEVTEAGNYTIHSLVYNPETLDLGIVEFGVTTGFDVFGLITEGGGSICASLDVAGAPVAVEAPMAGTLSGGGEACLVDGAAMLTASPNGDINVPAGYSSLFVLTQGEGLTLVNAGAEPSFEVAETGLFTIHTLVYNPATLDLGIVEFGVTTGVDVFGLISEGGGAICASLDVAGAPFNVEECACQAFAGTMTADADAACFGGYTTISAMANGDAVVPEGFSNIYVLTQGEGLVIVNAGAEPAFEVTEAGNYTIHSLVYDPATLDLGIVEFGVTSGFDVFGLITEGGGSICASLDVAGAPVAVENPDAGHIQAESFLNCFELGESTTLVGIPNGDAIVPDGYEVLYVLTQAWDLTILGVNTVPEFEVDSWNVYRIHTLVYNPATLDLSIVTIGETTGFDVFGLLVDGGGDVCASLDVQGALFFAWKPWICDFLGNFYHNMTVEAQEVQLQKWMEEADSPEALERLLIEAAADVAVYPNPTVDVLNVELTGFAADQPVQVELHDVTGRVVMATAWNAGSTDRFELDLAAHKAGQYHLVLTQGNVRIHRQVVIMR